MAREFAQTKLTIWSDEDFLDLTPAAQHLYFVLKTSPSLSYAGVADWRPNRIAKKARGWTVEQLHAAANELIEQLFILVDEETEEVLVRSFVRHDGLMKQPKMATAMASAHAAVASRVLRGVVIHELQRLHDEEPDLKGWGSEKALALLGNPSVNPSLYPLGMGLGNPSVKGNSEGSVKGSPTPSPSTAPTPSTPSRATEEGSCDVLQLAQPDVKTRKTGSYSTAFEEFWTVYPKRGESKGSKFKASKEWDKALKVVDRATLMAAIRVYGPQHHNGFPPDAERWLRDRLWEGCQAESRATTFEHLRATADAKKAAALIRRPWADPAQHPQDQTPRAQFLKAKRIEFIDQYEAEIKQALERRAG